MRLLPSLPISALAILSLLGPWLRAQDAAAVPAVAAGTASLTDEISALLATPAAERAHWGIAVVTLDGAPLYELHQGQLFRPASTAKLFTTAAAMALLGPNARTSSSISYATPSADGTVLGDVTLQGGNDADLSSERPSWSATDTVASVPTRGVVSFAAEIAARGVHRVTGDILAPVIWDPYPQGWAIEDMLWGYGAPVSSVSLNDNQVSLEITGGADAGMPAVVSLLPDTGFYRIRGSLVTTAKGTPTLVTVHHDPGDGLLRLQGSLPVGKMYRTEIAVEDPALFTAQAMRQALVAVGIAVEGNARAPRTEIPDASFLRLARQGLALPATPAGDAVFPPAREGTQVVTHESPLLFQDITSTLKESLNLHAELLLRRLGGLAGEATTVGGARVTHQWLLNIGIQEHDFALFDGSGLSTKDLVTPQAEASLLAYSSHQPWFALWKAALPLGGVDGTLASRFTEPPLKGHVFAKTGTLGESRALAGYLRCASGQELAFSIMVDNHEPGTQTDRDIMDRLVAAIAAAN